MHPYYHRAAGMVGQPVYVHAYGQPHYGILHHVTYEGCYLKRVNNVGPVSFHQTGASVALTPLSTKDGMDAQQVFWLFPLFFLPWLAIAALGPWYW